MAYAYNDQAFAPIQVGQTDASSVSDATVISRIEIFPNPVQDVMCIKSSNASELINIEILDMQGKVVKSHALNENTQLFVGDLTTGTYLVRFGNQSYSFVKD